MPDPFKPDSIHSGLWYPNASVIEDPASSGRYASIDLLEDPAGSGLYDFTALAPVSGPYWDWGDDGTSGRVTVTNRGTAPSWPTLRAVGGMSLGFIATDVDTGQVVRFDRPIPDGSMVTIDQRTGTASIDGITNDVSGFITDRDFFAVPAGASHQIQFAVLGAKSGTPQFYADLASAYL